MIVALDAHALGVHGLQLEGLTLARRDWWGGGGGNGGNGGGAIGTAALAHDGTDPGDGAQDVIVIDDWGGNPLSGNLDWTFEFWVRLTDDDPTNPLLSTGTGTVRREVTVFVETDGDVGVYHWGDSDWYAALTHPDFTWHHYAVSFDADGGDFSDGLRTAYLDGSPIGDRDFGFFVDMDLPKEDIRLLATDTHRTSGTLRAAAEIFDVRIWSVVRSSAEIAAAYDQDLTGLESGLVAWFPMTEGSGTPVDAQGNTTMSIDNTNARISWVSQADPR